MMAPAASAFEIGQVASSIVGALAALFAMVFGVYLGIKKYRQSKQRKEDEDDQKILDRFSNVEKAVEVIKTHLARLQADHTKLEGKLFTHLEKLAKEIDNIRNNCVRHNTDHAIADLHKYVDRLSTNLDRIKTDLDQYKQTVSDKFVPLSSYQGDMQMWSQTFNAFQQSVRDLQLMLNDQRRSGQ